MKGKFVAYRSLFVVMRKQSLFVLSLMVCFIASCANAPANPDHRFDKTPTSSLEPIQLPTSTKQAPPATSTFTKTAPPTLVTSTSTPMITSSPGASLKVLCVKIVPYFPPEVKPIGLLVLGGYGAYAVSGQPNPLLLDIETGDQHALASEADDQIGFVNVSPNHQWFAYKNHSPQSETSQLMIATADGQIRQTLVWEEAWKAVIQWLDDERLLMEALPHVLFWLNPFTGERQELPADYPGIYDIYPGPAWEEYSSIPTIYNTTLSQVIYPKAQEGAAGVALWDIQIGQEVTYVSGTVGFGYRPQWSPDEQLFVINNSMTPIRGADATARDQELYGLNQAGVIKRLTNLTSAYSVVEFGHSEWSPDGRYLAFWLEIGPLKYLETYSELSFAPEQLAWRLAVLDMTTGTVVNYCLPAGYALAPLVWSPDSLHIAVQIAPELSRRPSFIVDLQHGIAVKVIVRVPAP